MSAIKINGELLYQQKQRVYWLAGKLQNDDTIPESVKQSLDGIINLLDEFTDRMLNTQAVEVSYTQGNMVEVYNYFNDDRMTNELLEYEVAKELKES